MNFLYQRLDYMNYKSLHMEVCIYLIYLYYCLSLSNRYLIDLIKTVFVEKLVFIKYINQLNSDLETKRVMRSDAGYTVPNIINITGTVIYKLPNGRRIVYCQINGSQLEVGKSTTDYKWLNGQIILHSLASEFGCSSFYVNEEIIPINQSGILTGSNIGYGPAVQFWTIDGNMFFCLGRYYTPSYDFGLWQMSVMNTGFYSFSFIAQIW